MNTRPLRMLLFLLYQGVHTNTSNLTDDSDVNLEEVGGYFQGDMITPKGRFRSGLIHEEYLWPGGAVPYELNPFCTFTTKETKTWKKAVDLFAANTCIRFREKTAADTDYVSLQNQERGCYSVVGRAGGRQPLNLQPECNAEIGTVLHEMMHVLGIAHEQSREDRDEYVNIYWENIIPDMTDQFDIEPPSDFSTFGMPYDYNSLMHYSKRAFSKTFSKITMEAKDKKVKIGQRKGFSPGDISKINKMYKCPTSG